MPLNCELSTLSPTTCPRVTAVLAKDRMMAILEVANQALTMDTLEEVVNPVLMTGLAKVVAKEVANLALMMDLERAAAKAPANPALMEAVANPVLTMVTLEVVANQVPMMDIPEVGENPDLTMDTLEEVEKEEIAIPMTEEMMLIASYTRSPYLAT